jgi:DNA-binding transcriptional ArsR family regulator
MVKPTQPFHPHGTAECARMFNVLSSEVRLGVVGVLFEGPKHVGELEARLGVEQSLLSHHLRVLREAGIVQVEVDGRSRLYSLAIAPAGERRALDFGCCELVFEGGVRPALAQAPAKRRRGT